MMNEEKRTGGAAVPLVQRSAFHLPRSLRAFTLTEILIVIGIIVLFIALAVPALSLITGSNSINGAENNLSAMLGRARADALGLQRDTGVLFFIDPANGRVTLAEVFATDNPTGAREVFLDLVPDRDFLPLPQGVTAQVIDNCSVTGGVRADDGYIGYNTETTTTATLVPYGGVILFDSAGRLVARSYAFRGQKTTPSGTAPTDLCNLLRTGNIATVSPDDTDFAPATVVMRSQYGVILVDRETFQSNGNHPDSQIDPRAVSAGGAGAYTGTEIGEETWLDQNATPLMINRYNGTLVRGE